MASMFDGELDEQGKVKTEIPHSSKVVLPLSISDRIMAIKLLLFRQSEFIKVYFINFYDQIER
jgi:hypothetical protein